MAGDPSTSHIGLLNEGPLHAALKSWYAEPGDRFEVRVKGFVVDIVRDDLLLEIQTGSIWPLKHKLRTLSPSHRIRLVYPIAQEKRIARLAADGTTETARRSPRKGRVEDLFWAIVGIPALLSHPNVSFEVLMIREEEARHFVGKKRRRRSKGWEVAERRLVAVVDRRVFERPSDWLSLVPPELSLFTTRDLAEALGLRVELAQRMAYCLRHMSAIELIGKRGRANLYSVNEGPTAPA